MFFRLPFFNTCNGQYLCRYSYGLCPYKENIEIDTLYRWDPEGLWKTTRYFPDGSKRDTRLLIFISSPNIYHGRWADSKSSGDLVAKLLPDKKTLKGRWVQEKYQGKPIIIAGEFEIHFIDNNTFKGKWSFDFQPSGKPWPGGKAPVYQWNGTRTIRE